MIDAVGELFQELGTPPLEPWSTKEDNWWMIPFPLRPDRTSEEMKEEMASTAKVLPPTFHGTATQQACPEEIA